MNVFFDTSALVKLFHIEEGSEIVEELLSSPENDLWVLDLVRLEYLSVVFRRLRNGELSTDETKEAFEGFDEQLKSFTVESLGQATLKEAESIMNRAGSNYKLRSLDALHLAAFTLVASEDWVFVCADKTLYDVASGLGIKAINPTS